MAETKSVLIAGGGVAGPALALFLSRAGHKCTIVERAPDFRSSGQQIDVTGEGITVAKALGILDEIKERTVRDEGIRFVEPDNKIIGEFPVEGETINLVREIEIMRSDLAQLLYDKTREKVEYVFNEQIAELHQNKDSVTARFANGKEEGKYDIVVAADGLRSKTRQLAFPSSNTNIVSLNQYAAFFSIPWAESDETWSRACNATHGRVLCLRPNKKKGLTGAYLAQVTEDSGRFATMNTEEQKREVIGIFKDADWLEMKRILKVLEDPSDEGFYMAESAQAKSESLARGGVALLGDAGYCPAPVTGQGTTLALIGSYILAGCIATYPGQQGLAEYEKQMRPFIKEGQKLPPGAPWIISPQTTTGITVLKTAVWVAGLAVSSGLAGALSRVSGWAPSLGSSPPKLPEYPVLDAKT